MKKNVLIIAGASATSLAAGGAAGYLIAKARLEKAIEARIDEELKNSKAFYEKKYALVMEMADSEIAGLTETVDKLKEALVDYEDPAGVDISKEELDEAEEEEPALTPEDEEHIKALYRRGEAARVDYGGISTAKVIQEKKPSLDSLVGGGTSTNIFDEHGDDAVNKRQLFADAPRNDKPPMPSLDRPRDESGRFLPRQHQGNDDEPEPDDGDYAEEPYIITVLQFARGKENYTQESAKYYFIDETAVLTDGNDLDIEILGESNLELFPEEDGDEPVLYIRNDKTKTDYQVHLVTESLTAVTGFTDDGDPNSKYL